MVRSTVLSLMVAMVMSAGACESDHARIPIPTPDELGAAPFPDGATVGGLDATFAAIDWFRDGSDRCRLLLRFTPDGSALFTIYGCTEEGGALEDGELDELLDPDDRRVLRGDYAISGERVWIRMTGADDLSEEMFVNTFDGFVCGDRFVRQGADRPHSALSKPMWEYERVAGVPAATSESCEVPGFRVASRSQFAYPEQEARIDLLTDPGRECSLVYESADGTTWPADGSLDTIADENGTCDLRWPSGDAIGEGIATVTVGAVTHLIALDVRPPR